MKYFIDLATQYIKINAYVWHIIFLNVKEGITYVRHGGRK